MSEKLPSAAIAPPAFRQESSFLAAAGTILLFAAVVPTIGSSVLRHLD